MDFNKERKLWLKIKTMYVQINYKKMVDAMLLYLIPTII